MSAQLPPHAHEEESVGDALDIALLARLWRWVAPHKGKMLLTLALVFPMFAMSVAPEWIVKVGIDKHIVPQLQARGVLAAPAQAELQRELQLAAHSGFVAPANFKDLRFPRTISPLGEMVQAGIHTCDWAAGCDLWIPAFAGNTKGGAVAHDSHVWIPAFAGMTEPGAVLGMTEPGAVPGMTEPGVVPEMTEPGVVSGMTEPGAVPGMTEPGVASELQLQLSPPSQLELLLEAPAGVSPFLWLGGLMVAAYALLALLQYFQTLVVVATGQAAMRDLRREVFDHIQKLHLGFFDTYPVGRLVTRAAGDVEHLAEMFSAGLVLLITDILQMIGFAIVLFLVDAELALWTFGVVPPLALAMVIFRFKVREAFRTTRTLLARINTNIQETITGMKVVQLFARESRNQRDFSRLNGAHRDAWLKSIWYDSALFSVVDVAGGLIAALVIWQAAGASAGATAASAGTIYFFFRLMSKFFMPLRDLSQKYSVMQSSMASLERILQLLDTPPAIKDSHKTLPPPKTAAAANAPAVEFQNVWFAYNAAGDSAAAGKEEWILRGLSFKIMRGEKAAFVGASGAGKTTVIKLLSRLYEVTRGRILLEGVDIREIPQQQLRARVALVLQDVFLFSGSIESNLRLGQSGLSQAQLARAASAVEADAFIRALPRGYATEIRERGANFSTGQRQLLSFARALAHGADVLVLDEATSSIDTETEAQLQRGIRALMSGKTTLAVAHRLSTIQDVDTIYVLHQGRIVESGAHQRLLARGGFYARLHALQAADARALPSPPG